MSKSREEIERTILEILKEKINEFRKFDQYFGEYDGNSEHVNRVWVIKGEDEVKTEGGLSVIQIATPVVEHVKPINISKSYRARWEDMVEHHDYVFSGMMNRYNLEEYSSVLSSLHDRSIQETLTIEEFTQGKKAIDTLDEKGRYADTVLSSFVNPHLKEMDEFVQWYKYGPQMRDEKGYAFMGKLRHLDVFGVPQMNENQLMVYEKQNVGLNVSQLRAELESRYLLHVYVDLCVWLIKSDSCVSYIIV